MFEDREQRYKTIIIIISPDADMKSHERCRNKQVVVYFDALEV